MPEKNLLVCDVTSTHWTFLKLDVSSGKKIVDYLWLPPHEQRKAEERIAGFVGENSLTAISHDALDLALLPKDQVEKLTDAKALQSWFKEQEGVSQSNVGFALNAASGTPADGSEPALVTGDPKAITRDIPEVIQQSQSDKPDIYSSTLAAAGGARELARQTGNPILLLDLGKHRSQALLVEDKGIAAVTMAEAGFYDVLDVIRAKLSLKFEGSALKLFYDGIYDFSPDSEELVTPLAEKLKAALSSLTQGSAGTPQLMVTQFPANKAYFAQALAEKLSIEPSSVDTAALLKATRLEASPEVSDQLFAGNLGALFLASQLADSDGKAAAWAPMLSAPPALPKSLAGAAVAAAPIPAKPAEEKPAETAKAPEPEAPKAAEPEKPKQAADRGMSRVAAAAAGAAAASKAQEPKPATAQVPEAETATPAPAPTAAPVSPVAEANVGSETLPGPSRNYKIPAIVAIAAILVIVCLVLFMGGGSDKNADEVAEPSLAQSETDNKAAPAPAPVPVQKPEPVSKPQPVAKAEPKATEPAEAEPQPEAESVLAQVEEAPVETAPEPEVVQEGTLKITGLEEGLSVWIDGEEVGTTPLRGYTLSEGDHEVTLRKPNYQAHTQVVRIEADTTASLEPVTLQPIPGTATIKTIPASVPFFVEPRNYDTRILKPDEMVASTPASISALAPGEYRVTFTRSGWPIVRKEFTVEPGSEVEISHMYVPGSAQVSSEPQGANVYDISGNFLGRTPLMVDNLQPGTHTLRFTLQGHTPLALDFEVEANVTNNVKATLLSEDYIYPSSIVDSHPYATYEKKPTRPASLRGISGEVIVQAIIERNGEPSNLIVLQSVDPRLDSYVLSAIKDWRFAPAERGGSQVRTRVNIPVEFVREGETIDRDLMPTDNELNSARTAQQEQ